MLYILYLFLQNVDCNLWTAKLFPVCSDRRESCVTALQIIRSIEEKSLIRTLGELHFLKTYYDPNLTNKSKYGN